MQDWNNTKRKYLTITLLFFLPNFKMEARMDNFKETYPFEDMIGDVNATSYENKLIFFAWSPC